MEVVLYTLSLIFTVHIFVYQLLATTQVHTGFPGGSVVKNPSANAGDADSVPGLGRSLGDGNGNPLQYSFLGNPRDRGGWQVTVHGVPESRTQLSN